MKQARIHCPYCGSLAMLRPASAIHGLSDISAGTYLYVCRRWPACDAYVTADRRTKQPLGTLANGDLRHKRIALIIASFCDRCWSRLHRQRRCIRSGRCATLAQSAEQALRKR